jgi:hypothetical protein
LPDRMHFFAESTATPTGVLSAVGVLLQYPIATATPSTIALANDRKPPAVSPLIATPRHAC